MKTSRRNIIFITIASLLAIILFVYYNYMYEAPVNWSESYIEERKDPYGTFILYQLLHKISNNDIKKVDNPLSQFLKRQTHQGHANYVFVGDMLYLTSADADSLYSFAEKGNDVFISANSFPYDLNRRLFSIHSAETSYEGSDEVESVEEENNDESYESSPGEDIPVVYDTAGQYYEPAPAVQEPLKTEEEDLESLKAAPDSSNVVNGQEYTTSESEEASVETYEQETPVEQGQAEESITDTAINSQEIFENKYSGHNILLRSTDSLTSFQFTHPSLEPTKTYSFQYTVNFSPKRYNWSYFDPTIPLAEGTSRNILGYLNKDKPVFYRFKVGKGYIYYHSMPLTVTNFFLKQRINLEYANKVFAHLSPGQVYWDVYHKTYSNENSDGSPQQSPLKYLLSQPALAWAWYTSLAGIALYMLFFSKRKQRIIPLRNPNVNTSIEFVQTLGLMFRKSPPSNIAELKARNLKIFIWERYKIPSDLPMPEYVQQVASFSGIEEAKIQLIFTRLNRLKGLGMANEELAEYHHSIEYFHKNCK